MASTAFENAFFRLMKYEGGYSNDAADAGGETKWGISRRAYPYEDIPNLTIQQAKAIYLRDYWEALRLDAVKDPRVAGEIFEQAANFGKAGAVENAQRVLNFLGSNVAIDGSMGPITIANLNAYSDQAALACALNGEQYCRYKEIVANDPSQKVFARGWIRRLDFGSGG